MKLSNVRFLILILCIFTQACWASLQQTAPYDITFSAAARAASAASPALYLAAAPRVLGLGVTKVNPYKLSRIVLNNFDSGQSSDAVLQPFSPLTVSLDGTAGQDHPLKDPESVIGQLTTLAGQFPVFSVAKYPGGNSAQSPSFGGIFVIDDIVNGSVLSKANTPMDYSGEEIDKPLAALACSAKYVFAAVSKKGTQFDGLAESVRGIAILERKKTTSTPTSDGEEVVAAVTTTSLTPINASDTTSALAQALAIDLKSSAALMAFGDGTVNSSERVFVGRKACMAWDEGLQRLYVGFTDVRRDDASKPGGGMGVCCVAPRINAAGTVVQFDALPIVDSPSKNKFFKTTPVLTEWSDPSITPPLGAVLTKLTGVAGEAPSPGFSVSLGDLKICRKIVKAAYEYVDNAAVGTPATQAQMLLNHLKNVGAAVPGIFTDADQANRFLSGFDGVDAGGLAGGIGANNLYIFGKDEPIVGVPGGANSHANLRDKIKERYLALLNNAKIVNKAYAQGKEKNCSFVNALDFVVGFFSDGMTNRVDDQTNLVQARNDGGDDLSVSVPHIAVMNTSTNRPYLIVHSIMNSAPVTLGGTMYCEADNWVYAVPLIPTAVGGAEYYKGTVAQVTNDDVGKVDLGTGDYQPPQDIDGMPKRFQKAIRVGGGNPVPASWVQDLFVTGDSVYVVLAGPQKQMQGVFKSTAIFDAKGLIIDWTPATRVMGSVVQTFASMLDQKTGNFYSLTQTPTLSAANKGATTAQVTQWGKGTAAMHGGSAAYALDAVLGGIFDQKTGGVHGIASFDEFTYGFPKKQLSMLMAYGFDSCAFVETARRDAGTFTVRDTFIHNSPPGSLVKKNVALYSDVTLKGIAPLVCCGVVHNPPGGVPPGWTRFYVGGYSGLASIQFTYPSDADFLTNVQAMFGAGPTPFAEDVGFRGKHVIAVGQAGNYYHVVTADEVTATDVTGVPPAGAVHRLALSSATDALTFDQGSVVATSAGLEFVNREGTAKNQLISTAVIGNVMQLDALAARNENGLRQLPATIYLLSLGTILPQDVEASPDDPVQAGDDQTVVPQVWRVAVSINAAGVAQGSVIDTYQTNQALKGRPRPYAQYSESRGNFVVDGSVWFDVASKDGSNADFMRSAALKKPTSDLADFLGEQVSLTDVLNIDRNDNFMVGIPRRNSATGAWLVPGDWGLRVNE